MECREGRGQQVEGEGGVLGITLTISVPPSPSAPPSLSSHVVVQSPERIKKEIVEMNHAVSQEQKNLVGSEYGNLDIISTLSRACLRAPNTRCVTCFP